MISWFYTMLDQSAAMMEVIKDFFNSTFFTSIAGAFAGAYGAQVIAERVKYRAELINQIRSVNTAIMISFGICNSLISLKKQHVKVMRDTFNTQKIEILEHYQNVRSGKIPPDTELQYNADYQTLSLPNLPVNILQSTILEKVSINGRPISLVSVLAQTINDLGLSLEFRNKIIEHRKANELSHSEQVAVYFGFPFNGKINAEYSTSIEAIYNQTEDGIWFSRKLCQDLEDYGNTVLRKFEKNFRDGAPRVNSPDFSKADKLNLMPSDQNYEDWISSHQKVDLKNPEKKRSMGRYILMIILVSISLFLIGVIVRIENQNYAMTTALCRPNDYECLSTVRSRTSWVWHFYYAILDSR
ncbi:hypothetical protein JL101_012660 [Skermanella rosea]|uniref:hypothetical protein n=1 Tax=Skermanella rosea TaxID=1817965 RepID=UPI0019334DCD|nr:hypothetical protein [Skermanella rosea]UEM06242.1 hypothetical protein JL101_012660 [Skermanella rosea]